MPCDALSCDSTAAAAPVPYVVDLPASVGVNPTHGQVADAFAVTYALSMGQCSYTTVEFGWDGVLDPSWNAKLDPVTCSATVSLMPPASAGAGVHALTAEACSTQCDSWTQPRQQAAYTIDAPPPPPAVVSIAKAGDVTVAAPGSRVRYTLTMTVYPAQSQDVISIRDQLPAGVGNPTGISGKGLYDPATNSISWKGITVADGQRLTYAARVSPQAGPPGSTLVNTATIVGGLCEICFATASVSIGSAPAQTPTPTQVVTPGSSATPAPVHTPAPTGTPVPSATPAPTPAPTPSGSIAGITGTPEPSSPPPAAPATPAPTGSTTPAVVVIPIGAPRGSDPLLPALVASIPDPSGLRLDPAVLGTNMLLTVMFVFLFGLTSEIFNSTIDEHREEVEGWFDGLVGGPLRFLRPLTRADAFIDGLTETGRSGAVVHGLVILGVIGVVYGFLSTDIGLNEQTLILVASLMAGVGLVTYLNYGGKSLLIRRRHRAHSMVRMYGTAVGIAAVCVLASRLVGFHPGIVYGFIASTVVLTPLALEEREEARLVLLPAAVLLAVSLAAWLLLIPVRAAAVDGALLTTLAESILSIVFVGGLEGLLFNLMPIRFMDGAKVMAWSRPAWAVAFGVVVFLWWQLLLNRNQAYVDALRQTSVTAVIAVVVFFALTTGTVWTYFRVRDRDRPEGEGGSLEGPGGRAGQVEDRPEEAEA
jgi:hypothetical protein